MAYFANGSEGGYYLEKYCQRCQNWRKRTTMGIAHCPVIDLHFDWNYDAVGSNADETKKHALNTLWPQTEDGIHNADCAMFLAHEAAEAAKGGE